MDREHAAREVVCVVRSSVGSVFPRSSPAHATTPRSHIAEMPLSVNVQFVTIQVRRLALPELGPAAHTARLRRPRCPR